MTVIQQRQQQQQQKQRLTVNNPNTYREDGTLRKILYSKHKLKIERINCVYVVTYNNLGEYRMAGKLKVIKINQITSRMIAEILEKCYQDYTLKEKLICNNNESAYNLVSS